ncbi:MAG: translation initiation factor IF-2, partial [Bacteroidales bacterium]|nr:translation initiation factor IF-2 [Bacteroidales bacterium]
MIANESIRISKVVKELNIGIGTLVDFLKKKGIDVDPSPNSKLTTEAYLLAQKEFDKEHRLKEQSKKIVFKVVESAREEPVLVEPPTVAVEKPPVVKEPEPAPEYKPEPAVASVVSEPQPTPQTPPIQAPSVQTPPAPAPPAQAPAEEKISGPKVIGKIDLSPKPKPQKDGPRGGKQQKKGQGMPQNRPKPQARPKPQSEIPVRKLDTKPEETTAPSPAAVQHIETKVQKLTGPTITGNIDLSQFEKKKPTTESSPERRKKGKRERIHKGQREKVDVAKIAAKTRSTGDGKAAERKGKERFKPVRNEVDEDAVQKQIKETYARMVEGKGKTKGSKYRREKRGLVSQRMQEEQERQERQSNVLEVTEFVTVNELATMMQRPVVKVIEACMNLGLMVSINQRLDAEAMVLVAEEFGFEVKFVSVEIQDAVEQVADTEEDLQSRPPIVTVMGHVDHGKTSLLDYIRKSNVIAGEAGGITQHIGAYNVHLPNGRQITFLDTPGHEAFTAMRARGAKVTDLAIIIVAADDAVMPQTIEAINHAVAAGVPMIFAINKIDKPGANSEKIREQLANMNFLVEDWGGKYQCQEISAKQGINMDKLLEKILLEADLLDLKANPRKYAVGTVIESSLDKGRGYLATILIQSGSLRVGDAILSGIYSGRVKAMFNERGQKI